MITVDFEVQVMKNGDNTQIGVLFNWPSQLIDRSQQFHDVVILPATKLIWDRIRELNLQDNRFLAHTIKIRGLEMEPVIGSLWDLPCARLLRAYDGQKDELFGRIDVLL